MALEWGTIVRNLNWTLLFNVALFGLLVLLLKRYLLRPALAWLDGRRELEQNRLRAAEEARAEASRLREERESELAQANRRAREILAAAEAEGQDFLRRARQEARLQAQAIVSDAEAVAARVRDQALIQLRSSYAELVVEGAAAVLRREVQREDHGRLLEELTSRVDTRLLH